MFTPYVKYTADDTTEMRVHPSILFVRDGSPVRAWCTLMDPKASNTPPNIQWFFPNGTEIKNIKEKGDKGLRYCMLYQMHLQ